VKGFVAKRLAFTVPQLLVVVVGTFLLLRLLPVDPVAKIAGFVSTESAKQQARDALGLNGSVWDQLKTYLGQLVQGNLGTSWTTHEPVRTEIWQRFPVTIQLILLAFMLALAVAIPLGRIAATRPDGKTGKGVLTYSLFAGAQPEFWWGLIFIFLLYVKAKLFPAPLGVLSPEVLPPEPHTHFILIDTLIAGDFHAFKDALWHFCLPVLTLAFVLTGPLIKMTRQSVLSVVNSDHVLYAHGAGLPEKKVKRQVMRNALAPVVTLSGILFGFMLGGAVLVEFVFSLDGLGKYVLDRTFGTDFPAVQGAVVVMTAFSLGIYLLMDIVYSVLDPRVRYGAEK
jgi:ABC-type dipeptide/oligopeptide/nickel transport system permease component